MIYIQQRIKTTLFESFSDNDLKQEINKKENLQNYKEKFITLCGSALFELFYRQHKIQNTNTDTELAYTKATPISELLSDYPESVRDYIYTILRNIDKSQFVIAYKGEGYNYKEVTDNNNYQKVNGFIRYQFVRANIYQNRKSIWIQDKNPIGWMGNPKEKLTKVYAFADEEHFLRWLECKSFSVFMKDFLIENGLEDINYNSFLDSYQDGINDAKYYRVNLRRIMGRKISKIYNNYNS